MAIGTTAAILGSAAIGAGAGLYGASQQAGAARDAANIAQGTSADQTALYRDIYNQQRADYEPFRQSELRRAGLVDTILGVPAPQGQTAQPQYANQNTPRQQVGRAQMAAYVDQYPGLQSEFQRVVQAGGFGASLPRSYDQNGNGRLEKEEYGQFHYDRFGQGEGRMIPQITGNPVGGAINNVMTQGGRGSNQVNLPAIAAANGFTPSKTHTQPHVPQAAQSGQVPAQGGPLINPNANGAENVNNSIFAAAAQAGLNRDIDRIDSALANDGLLLSGTRQTAAANAAADRAGQAVSQFMQAAGSPVQMPATNAMANAAGNYGANSGNALGNAGNAAMQSAYAQGNAYANGANAFGNAALFGLGGLAKPGI